MVYSISRATPGQGNAAAPADTTANGKLAGERTSAKLSEPALKKAAESFKSATAARTLETTQRALASDMRAALGRLGLRLTAGVEFSFKSDGSVDIKGSEADRASVRALLDQDRSQPSFASRIATQAKSALELSATIQKSAAISQAARSARTPGGVISLYTSLMQTAGGGAVVFALSAASSSLSYPGSLATRA